MSHLPLATPAQLSRDKGRPPPVKVQASGMSELPKSTDQNCSSYTQPEAQKILSFSESSPADTGKSQLGHNLKGVVDSRAKNDGILAKLPPELRTSLSGTLRPVGIGQPRFSQYQSSVDGSLVRACPGGTDNFQSSCDLNASVQSSGNSGSCDKLSGFDSLETLAYTIENEKRSSTQDEVHSSRGVSSDDVSKRDRAESDCKSIEPDSGAADEEELHSVTEKVVLDSGCPKICIHEHNHSKHVSSLLNKSDENRLPYGKSTYMASERLWDGSLQLNSAISVSAVAFFKSGEMLLDASWSKNVEVKGKVRLEAFERYIQDLPRSRTRGLMVISLDAKEGSSDKGLKGMKEVSRGYRKGERVGFAQLSPGVDLYLCPRSDKIFTILAKHGYFKGKAAVGDKSDLLIGCVVWRKNRTDEGCVTKEKDDIKSSLQKQGQDPKSLSDSSTQNGGERSMSSVLPIQKSISVSVRPSSAVENMNITNKSAESGHSSGANSFSTSPVPAKSSGPVEQQGPKLLHKSSQTAMVCLLQREASFIGCSEQPKSCLELPKKFSSVPFNVVPTAEDDDLPEYDFGSALGISFTSLGVPVHVPTADTRLQTERVKNLDQPMLPASPVVHSISASNCGTDNLSCLMLPSNANQVMPLPKSIAYCDAHIHASGKLEDRHKFQRYAFPAAVSTPPCSSSSKIPSDKSRKRNFFCDDDDDDMPEWLPQHQKPPLVERNKSSSTILSESSPSTFQDLVGRGRPLLSPPSMALTRPEFPSEGLTQSCYQSIHLGVPPSFPTQNDASSLTGHHDRVLRPSCGSLPVKQPLRSVDGRMWRP